MAGVSIKITVNVQALRAKLEAVAREMENEPLLRAIGERQLAWINENFETAGGNVGGWEPLAASTIARKGSSGILLDTGRLRHFTYEVSGGSVRVGTAAQYASYHEEGTPPYTIVPRSSKGVLRFQMEGGWISVKEVHHPGLPKRRMLPTEEEGKDMAVRMIEARIEAVSKETP